MKAISRANAEHYLWGAACDGWRLADGLRLSIIEERMPPGTAEKLHFHQRAEQFFYVLGGLAHILFEGTSLRLGPGEGVAVPAGVAHQMRNDGHEDLRFLVISQPTTRGDRHLVEGSAPDGARSRTARRPALASLRPAREGDLAAINDIYNHYVAISTCTMQLQPSTGEERRAWFAEHGSRFPVWVAEEGGTVVGWGSLSPYHARPGYFRTAENSVYVRHDFQGRGVGGAMLARLIELAKEADHRSIVARITSEQHASLALHVRFGFEPAGVLRAVGWKFERWMDVHFLQLNLSSS